jgi:hypothetical protein
VRVLNFNSLKCVIGNKKCKNSGPLRPYKNQGPKGKHRSGVHVFRNPNFTLIKDSRRGLDY